MKYKRIYVNITTSHVFVQYVLISGGRVKIVKVKSYEV